MSGQAAAPLRARLRPLLGPRARLLDVCAREADRRGASAYLVGGPVRDLLLEREIGDLDVLLSGELEEVTAAVARALQGEARLYRAFLTATVDTDYGRLDLARARRERYEHPGALPSVRAGDVEGDLGRRDFSIHALALPLSRRAGTELLDPFDGCADLERGRLRVLHDASFLDDPTRLLRAARYAGRLRFGFDPRTRRALGEAVRERALDRVSGDRVRAELERLLAEDAPERAASWLHRLELDAACVRGWSLQNRRGLARLARARRDPPWPEAAEPEIQTSCGWRLLLAGSGAAMRERFCERLALRGRAARMLLQDLAAWPRLRRALGESGTPGAIDARLSEYGEGHLLFAFCEGSGRVPARVARYAREWRRVPDPVDGHAARRLGLRGPAIGRLLQAARRRALDGRDVDRVWLERWLATRG